MSKTITLDDRSYKLLRKLKLPGESFSDVIKKHLVDALTPEELDALIQEAYRQEEKEAKREAASR